MAHFGWYLRYRGELYEISRPDKKVEASANGLLATLPIVHYSTAALIGGVYDRGSCCWSEIHGKADA